MRNKTDHAYVCIGGPYDGRRFASSEMGFRVFEQPPFAYTWTPDKDPQLPVEIHTMTYEAYPFRSSEKELVWIWKPVDQSLKRTMEMLLERYEQSSNLIFQGTPARLR